MKKLLVTLAAVLVSVSSFAQGTLVFNNRGLANPSGSGTYNSPINGVTDPATAGAQLYIVDAGGARTAIPGTQVFRPAPNQQYFTGPITVTVPNQPPGTAGLRFVIRAWQGGTSYETSSMTGESAIFTVAGGLGGVPPTGAPITPPGLGGPGGLDPAGFTIVPEPSTIALGLLGAAALLLRRRK
jgi:hypothetical protein